MRDDFTARVLTAVRAIPPGLVATYGDVAALAGRPRAARAVGTIMQRCKRADVPCHRVVAAGGRLGGYAGNPMLKRSLLASEGVVFKGGRIHLEACRVKPRKKKAPAARRKTVKRVHR